VAAVGGGIITAVGRLPPKARAVYVRILTAANTTTGHGAEHARTYAAWPVWSDSTTEPVRFQPMPKKAAVRLWHRARDFDRGTHQPGRHGGAVGHVGLAVLHALIFDFLNHRTGRLDPSYEAIARKAGVCVRTVASALMRLREVGNPELGPPVRRKLAGWALRARAADQRIRRAAGGAVARLPAASRAGWAFIGHVG